MPFSEESLKTYIIKNFMNSAINIEDSKHNIENPVINYPVFQEKNNNFHKNSKPE